MLRIHLGAELSPDVQDMPNFGIKTGAVYNYYLSKLAETGTWNTAYVGTGGFAADLQSGEQGASRRGQADPMAVTVAGCVLGAPLLMMAAILGQRGLLPHLA